MTAAATIFSQLESKDFEAKLQEIHRNFPNIKLERHIANALVTSINNTQKKFVAYSEVEKIDICLYEDQGRERKEVELKYHFAPDFWRRYKSKSNGQTCEKWLESEIARYNKKNDKDKNKSDGVVHEVLKDICRESCDIFIHIIADRHGADRSWSKEGRHRLNKKGVPIAFLNDQITLEESAKKEGNALGWTEPLIALWKRSSERGFNCLQRKTIHVHKRCDKAPPLWLHFVVLTKEDQPNSNKPKDFFEDLTHWNSA